MTTKLTRYILSFTDAQLESFRLRFPEAANDKEAIYRKLEIEPPKHGGAREGAGMKPRGRRARRGPKTKPARKGEKT